MKKFNNSIPLSNIDIDEIMKDLNIHNFKGCFMRDQIPKLLNNECIIINLDNNLGDGTHWTGAYMTKNKLCYFDSFGLPFPNELKLSNNKQIEYNNTHYQNEFSSSCGWFCIYFINELNNGKSYYDTMYNFDIHNQSNNEKYIKNYFKNLGY